MSNACYITTPLPDGALRLSSCTARESLSVLGDMTISVLAADPNLSADKLLGKPATVAVTLRDSTQRELSGYITRFVLSGTEGAHYVYQMTVRPWLWLLTRTADCRIFQDLSVPDIVRAVFEDHPVANFEFKLFRQYRKWSYCVQYRETDFNFVARLLEHEGIYWYFEHHGGRHKLILVDSASVHDASPGHASLPYYGHSGQHPPDRDYADDWAVSREIEPGRVTLTDYDFEHPSASLRVEQAQPRSYDISDAEVFDFPGGYAQSADGLQYCENRLDEFQSEFEVVHGSANTVGLRVGHTLSLTRHPRENQNAKYLLTTTNIQIQHPGYEAGASPAVFRCDFSGIAATQQYRPARRTPKPCVHGPQSAVVVGPPGQEVFTDKYGRVKVQFHWDRRGQRNANSSCWLRVSSPWAGSGYGAVHIPRIGHEVLVGFLEGDPDAPLVIGRVNNAHNLPSTFSGTGSLPGNHSLAGYKSKEIGGSGYSQVLFDDTTGQVRTQLCSTEGASQLNLGWLVHPRDDQAANESGTVRPTAQPRGEGFELRTDQWGAVRAAKGLLITTDGRTSAVGGTLDRSELVRCLEEALDIAKQLSDNAKTHLASTGKDERTDDGFDTKPQAQQLREIKGLGSGSNNEAQATDPSANQLALHSPAGIVGVTPKTIALTAGEHANVVAHKNLHTTSGQQTHIHATTGLRQFSHSGGIHLIANEGKVLIQSQHADTAINAEQSIHLSASQKHITLDAKQHITLSESGGAYIKLEGGNIELGMPGTFTVKAASYKFVGPASQSPTLPMFPGSSCKECLLDAMKKGVPGVIVK